jgi:hypothetical protein
MWNGAMVSRGVLKKLTKWRSGDPRFWKSGERTMGQRQWTIEVRADVGPQEKEAIKQTIRRMARHLLTQVQFLPTKVQVEVACFSDDFFDGHEDIELWEDVHSKVLEQHDSDEEQPSAELLQAARDMQHDR